MPRKKTGVYPPLSANLQSKKKGKVSNRLPAQKGRTKSSEIKGGPLTRRKKGRKAVRFPEKKRGKRCSALSARWGKKGPWGKRGGATGTPPEELHDCGGGRKKGGKEKVPTSDL